MRKVLWTLALALCLPLIVGCGEGSTLPLGSYNYKMMVNDKEVGTGNIGMELSDGKYISSLTININMAQGPISVEVTQSSKTVETKDFVPVSCSSASMQKMGEQKQEMKIEAVAKGNKLEIDRAGNKTTVDLPSGTLLGTSLKPLGEMVKNKFAPGTKLTYNIIEPTMGDKAEESTLTVIGKEDVDYNGSKMKLNKITQNTKAVSATMFCDDKGVIYVMEIPYGPLVLKMVKK